MRVTTVVFVLASTVLFRASALQAQKNESLYPGVIPEVEGSYASATVVSMPTIGNEISTDPGGNPSPQGGTTTGGTTPAQPVTDDHWHIAVSPYLWFPGVHGTIGALGHDLGYSASPADLLSNFRFG